MAENVGAVEVTVILNSGDLRRQARRTGDEAGEDLRRGMDRSLRDFQRSGRDHMRGLLQNMERETDQGADRIGRRLATRFRRSFGQIDNPFQNLTEGMTQFSRRALGLLAGFAPIIVPLIALIAEIGPAFALALPAVAALGAGIGVIALSMDQLGTAFQPLVEGFKSLQGPIGDILTRGVRPLVQELTSGLIPVLETGFGAFARVMNQALKSFLQFTGSASGLQLIETILVRLADATQPLLQAFTPLVHAILVLTRAAIPGFKSMNTAILDLVTRFDEWVTAMARSGDLQRDISEAASVAGGVLRFLGNVFLGLIDGGRRLFDILSPVGDLFRNLGLDVRDTTAAVLVVAGVFFGLLNPIIAVFSAVSSLVGVLGGLATFLGISGAAMAVVIGVLAALVAGFVLVWQNSERFRTALAGLGSALVAFGQTLIAIIVPAVRALWQDFQNNMLPAIRRVATQVGNNLAPALVAMGEFIRSTVIPAVQSAARTFARWWPTIRQVIVFLGRMVAQMIIVGSFIVGTLIPVVLRVTRVLIGQFRGAINAARTAFNFLRTVIGNVASSLSGALSTAISAAKTALRGLKTAAGIAKSALDGFQSILGTIAGAFNTAADAVQNLINKIAAIPDKIDLPDLPDLNPLAKGGVITRPTLAMMGEGFRPEAVIPLTNPKRALALMKETGLDKMVVNNAAPAASNVTNYNPTFNITTASTDPVGFAHQVDNRLRLRVGV